MTTDIPALAATADPTGAHVLVPAHVLQDELFTPHGVRLRARRRRPGASNWLFLPGGPGIGSASLHELVDALDVPGTCWLVDLPGDGSNVHPPHSPHHVPDPYGLWPHVLLEAAEAVPHPVFVGHSTGGEYLLSVPELEPLLSGLVIVSSAPTADWMPVFEERTRLEPLPAVEEAEAAHAVDPGNETLRQIAVASTPWNFSPAFHEIGAELLARMPYNLRAVEWSAENFDTTYRLAWWPSTLPTLVLSGDEDRIVVQHLWQHPCLRGANVTHVEVPDAGHWPWIENRAAVTAAFAEFAAGLPSAS